jgi:hypothetical protein
VGGLRHLSVSPNGLKLSGERSGAERVRCSAVFGGALLLQGLNPMGRIESFSSTI